MAKYCIYTIFNSINGKIYVGKTTNPQKRFDKHIKVALYKRTTEKFVIHKAIEKYGKDNFIFSILQIFNNEEDCTNAEKYWIKYFNSNIKEFGYNLTAGGEGVSGRVVSEETKRKISLAHIGMTHTEATKEKLRVINLGKIPTNIEQLKTINIGKPLSEEHKKKISEARKGIVFTEEHRMNMSKAMIGLMVGENHPCYGRKHTEEVKAQQRGENNKQAKLTVDDVRQIRKEYAKGLCSQQELANRFRISREQVGRIVRRIDWKHVE